MALIFHDQFTRASDVTLASHTPTPIGTSWTFRVSTAGRLFEVNAARDICRSDGGGGGNCIYTAQPAPAGAEYDVSLTLAAIETSDNAYSVGLVARWTDNSNYYFARMVPGAQSTDKTIYKVVAGTATQLASGDSGNAVSDVLLFQIRDATKKLFKNGAEQCSTTDNALTSIGQGGVGLGLVAGDSVFQGWEWDEFKIDEAAAAAVADPYDGSILRTRMRGWS